MTAKYVFHLETEAELQTCKNIHHKWDLTNITSVILDKSSPLLSTVTAKLDSKVWADLEDTLTVSTLVILGHILSSFDGAIMKSGSTGDKSKANGLRTKSIFNLLQQRLCRNDIRLNFG